MRFAEQMPLIADKLELEKGYCVLQPMYCRGRNLTADQLKALTAAHYKKIDISDGVYIVNIGGYVGQSVAAEIEYARVRGKQIIYHE